MSQNDFIGGELHRLAKLLMDTGEVSTIFEAEEKLKEYCLGIYVQRDVINSPAYQAALLTAVNTGRRCFLGGVQIAGDLDVPLKISWRRFQTVAEAVQDLQGKVVDILDNSIPLISFSDKLPKGWEGEFGIKPTIRGWSGGVLPVQDKLLLSEKELFTPAGVLAGAIAISEAFQFVRGGNTTVGYRSVGASLWKPARDADWLNADPGPNLVSLPQKLWLIGLGNLGQAYLWTLGFLPYKTNSQMKGDVDIVLQDTDYLEKANDSTSLLTDLSMVGLKKTRAMSEWCKEYGFITSLIERKFTNDFKVNDREPHLALCGVDNAEARANLEKVGFKKIVEAGLGKGVEEFLCFRLHTFPSSKPADVYWGGKLSNIDSEKLIQQPAYQDLHERGVVDQCGLTELAGRSVGAPFVGAIASAFVIAEVLRIVNGGLAVEVVDGDLRSLSILNKVISMQIEQEKFNPGMINV